MGTLESVRLKGRGLEREMPSGNGGHVTPDQVFDALVERRHKNLKLQDGHRSAPDTRCG